MKIRINSLKSKFKGRHDRLAYIVLLVISGTLILSGSYLFLSRDNPDQAQKLAIIKQQDRHFIKFGLTNNEPVGYYYRISVTVDGNQYDEDVLIGPDGVYTYRHTVHPPIKDKMINISVFKENELVSENTYLLD